MPASLMIRRRKYELQQFLQSDEQLSCPFPNPDFCSSSSRCSSSSNSSGSGPEKKHYEKQSNDSWRRKESEYRYDRICWIDKGQCGPRTNLAVLDTVTSDPYVILSLRNLSVKTRVIKNNLNPVWNEQLMTNVVDSTKHKLLMYDKDTFKPDDFMGNAEIDIQPLGSAANASENSSIREPMQLGKWVASKDNTLVRDGIIIFIDGKVKQEIALRLQNVQRGVFDIELECVPLAQ